jgi:hypothetical protein
MLLGAKMAVGQTGPSEADLDCGKLFVIAAQTAD